MDSVSEDASESSLGGPSLRRLLACPNWDRIGDERLWTRLVCIPVKPGEKHHPTATQNECQERGNRCGVLRHALSKEVSTANTAAAGLPKKHAWTNIQDTLT
jgi:hypothetical protein